MTNQPELLNENEQSAVASICILAAFADGALRDDERDEIKRIVENFSDARRDLTLRFQETLSGKTKLAELVPILQSANARALAYEMAVCICQVDQSVNAAEEKFLAELRGALNLDTGAAAEIDRGATQVRQEPPIIGSVAVAEPAGLDEMIRESAVLAGALELMPQRLATMAIVPVQMRMVYKIGKAHGHELDLSHAKEFFATLGVGLTSQALDGFLSKLLGNVTRRFVGRFAGALVSQATESAVAFATTYALGQVAKTYYQSGRTLSTPQLKQLFSSMFENGRAIQARYAGQIAQRAGSLKIADFAPLARF